MNDPKSLSAERPDTRVLDVQVVLPPLLADLLEQIPDNPAAGPLGVLDALRAEIPMQVTLLTAPAVPDHKPQWLEEVEEVTADIIARWLHDEVIAPIHKALGPEAEPHRRELVGIANRIDCGEWRPEKRDGPQTLHEAVRNARRHTRELFPLLERLTKALQEMDAESLAAPEQRELFCFICHNGGDVARLSLFNHAAFEQLDEAIIGDGAIPEDAFPLVLCADCWSPK